MSVLLVLAFLFYIGAIVGWCLEFLFRNLISHKGPRGKHFINPGLCKGPWLPIYGVGVSFMFLITWIVTHKIEVTTIWGDIAVILSIAITMVLIELIGGLFLLKVLNLRLWDYRQQKGNFMGIICPRFTLIWGSIGAIYYLFLHNLMIKDVLWLSENLTFSFVVGLFWGLFIVDLVLSSIDAAAIKKYADDHEVIVKYEELKALILEREAAEKGKKSKSFFSQGKHKNEDITKTLNNASNAFEKK